MRLSIALERFIAANVGPYSWYARNPYNDESDSYEYNLNTTDPEELKRMNGLVAAFVAGWRMRRAAEEEENRNSIVLRDIIDR